MITNLLLKRMLLLWVFAFSTTVWGQTTVTYTFSNKSWAATPSNWTSGKDGLAFQNGQGIQITTGANGAFGNSTNSFSNISVVKVHYSTNSSKGVGTITPYVVSTTSASAQSGTAIEGPKSVTTTGGTTTRSLTYTAGTPITGNLQIYVTCTTNSIYIHSVDITYEDVPVGPIITATPSSLSGFTYVEGSGPSAEQSFSVGGFNLTNDITVTPPTNYEISTIAGFYSGTFVTLAQSGGTVNITTIYARLKSGLAVGAYNNEEVKIETTGATSKDIALSGNVTPIPSVPGVTDAELTGTVGQTFSYQVIASNEPTNYFVSSETLPAGLSLNEGTGLIIGIPTEAGEFLTGIEATNAAGTSEEGVFVFTILKGTQTVALPDLNAYQGGDDIILPEFTDNGLPIEYISGDESVATISGKILTIVGLGSTEIFAANDGNANYDSYTDSFTINVTEAPILPCFTEYFASIGAGNNTTTAGSSSAWDGNENFPTITTGYQAGGAVRLGSGSSKGSITSKTLSTIGGDVRVTLDVKGWTAVEGSLIVSLGSQSETIAYSAKINDAFEAKTLDFINVPVGSTLKIETTAKRAFIDNVTVSCGTVTVWTGSWSNGTPDATKVAIIAGDYNQPLAAGIVAKSITVNADTTFIVYPSVSTGDVTNNGQIIVSSYGNFVHNGAFDVGEGSSFKVSRTSKEVKRYDYIAWSSPLKDSPQTLKEFSYGSNNFENQSTQGTANNRFYKYNDGNYVATPHTGTFNPAGQGFQIRTPNDFTTTPQNFWGLFVGTEPNVGEITYNASAINGQYVLLGNPYPSALDMEQFFVENNQITGVFYIWDSGNTMDAVTNEYLGSNYNTYNKTGTVPSSAENGYVPVGQGFFVDRGLNTIPSFKFTNAMRSIDRGGSFSKAVSDRFWLQMTTPSGSKPQMLIGFNENATSGYDAGYDAKMFDNNADVLYSTVEGKSLIIDAHGTFTNTDVVNVTANFLAAGNYTIGIAQKEGIFANTQQIYLKDNLTGTETELTAGDYTFAATAGLQADRFTVSFNKGVLASSNTTKGQSTVYASDQIVYVNASTKIASVEVYDMSGKLIKKSSVSNSQNTFFPVSYKGITVVKLVLENGGIVTKKIILK
ncbi:MAG: T9SS type A sorting domain-containing protein [Flavobacteriales bacterium]|nr:T9SS type A sorting domain-containing protein [Flavobacteriales bacterium]